MFKPGTPGTNGAEIMAQFLENDKQNQALDDTAVINTGVAEGTVVKWSSSLSKWVLCDGTVALENTDTIGVVTYASGTSGQVKTSGVYVDADLATLGKYYCQSDGTIGQTATKVFIGTVTSTGRLCMPGGGGGGVQPATTENLGGVIVGAGLLIDINGVLSAPYQTISITTGTIANGGTIPLPSGYTREQCKYAVMPVGSNDSHAKFANVNQSTGVVTAYEQRVYYDSECAAYSLGYGDLISANYLCIGVK